MFLENCLNWFNWNGSHIQKVTILNRRLSSTNSNFFWRSSAHVDGHPGHQHVLCLLWSVCIIYEHFLPHSRFIESLLQDYERFRSQHFIPQGKFNDIGLLNEIRYCMNRQITFRTDKRNYIKAFQRPLSDTILNIWSDKFHIWICVWLHFLVFFGVFLNPCSERQ